MKRHKHLLKLLILTSCMASSLAYAQDFILPVRPSELLQCLPVAGKDWNLTVSNAEHILQTRPMTKAMREYVSNAEVTSGTSHAAKPSVVQLTLLDTGGNEDIATVYTDPKIVRGERFSIGAFPAARIELASGETDHVEVLLLNRFVLTVVLAGSPTDRVDRWVGKVDIARLQALMVKVQRVSTKNTYFFTAEHVDEINPGKSGTSPCNMPAENPTPFPKKAKK